MHLRAETFKNATEVVTPNVRLAAARDFFNLHGKALANAAHLLADASMEARVYRFLERLRDADSFSTALVRDLVAFHRLLTLQDPGSLESSEFGCIPHISPEDPVVIEICLLADNLWNLLADIDRQSDLQGEVC
ncbi:hypothetical protein [Rhodovulum steppense]|uniref:Uncharacterized protein n=1 Tax=Rhodovulum steppense TaxID=540251 RepID=A0A4R1YC38_9RHOB|nr:hypothetical protein [Rhodovulum steppense]TCM73517.1 hypothetical protein EV216_1496 [Rhodovulum steppense]